MVGFVIIGGLFLQSVVAQISRVAAAVVGYAITTGVLIWGLSVYKESDSFEEHFVTIFGIELSQSVFVVLCLAWYGFDTWHLVAATMERQATQDLLQRHPQLADEHVVRFYSTAFTAWAGQKLALAEPGPEGAQGVRLPDFVDKYPPDEGTALGRFFETWQQSDEELLAGLDNRWFALTNLRLIQKDGRDDRFKEVVLADVEAFEVEDSSLVFKMRAGGEVSFERVESHPEAALLSSVISPGDAGPEIETAAPILQAAPATATGAATGAPAVGMVGRHRNPLVVLLLMLVTLGIYGLYWFFITFTEVRARRGEGIGGFLGMVLAFPLVPASLFLLPSYIGQMYAAEGRDKPMTGWTGLWALLIPPIGSAIWLFKVQGRLNEFWAGASQEAEAATPPEQAPAAEPPA